MKNYYTRYLTFLAVLFLSISVSAQYEMLFLGKGATEPADSLLMEYLTLEGDYNITFVPEADYKNNVDTDWTLPESYDNYDVFFVLEDIGSSSANNFKTAGFPIPTVSTEGYCVRDGRWGFLTADESGDSTYFKQGSGRFLTEDILTMVIFDTDHRITKNYEQDYELVWSTSDAPEGLGVTGFELGEAIDGAIPLAEYYQSEMDALPTLWAIPDGSEAPDGSILPRMAIFGTIVPGLGTFATEEVNELMLRCVLWVTDNFVNIEETDVNGRYGVIAGPNPTNGMVKFSINLPESGMVGLNIYDITGKMVKSHSVAYMNEGKNDIQFDLSDLSDAHYIYRIATPGNIWTGKIIKN